MVPTHRTSTSRERFIPAALLLACAMTAAAALLVGGGHDEEPPRPSAAQALSASGDASRSPVRPLPPADPVRLRISAIGVDAPMTRVGLDAAGTLRTPPAGRPGLVGWYGDGPVPGTAGTAITTGHVDTPTGDPGVFYDLGTLTKGDIIEIARADRRTAVFTVRAVELYDREELPSETVYGSSGRPELRLITCGGGYTKRTGYLSNVVVFATLTAVT
ncbi:class F sortase [Streptomyces cinerochromogenes]|uniref:class F sortase n=1 Tax=Streptomyces cinerochromogenes TaxID=66422 RepID=UPI0019C509CB|nr:class F sortase [Streptomyces cinerochromogenes]GGS55107.1 class F sortase [Streptomyces cinerochromogenes]